MSRRALTLLLAAVLAVVLTAGATVARVPYVALVPGPTFNTLGADGGSPVLAISGRQTFPTDGHLDLTTVGVRTQLTLAEAIKEWFDRDNAVVPREIIYPPDKSQQEVEQENTVSMQESQSNAVTAAARQLGFVTAKVTVGEIPAGSPSTGLLAVGDTITSVDGTAIRDAADLRELVSAAAVGTSLRLGVLRAGASRTVAVTTAAAAADAGAPNRSVIGVSTKETPVKAPFSVDISLQDVGGPSAGLMFTLGILDKLGKDSLTGGKYFAGTGEISADGTVGPIGGIAQKLVAAKAKGAVAFFVPAENCVEALKRHPAGLPLVEVASVGDALVGLQAIRRGQTPKVCGAAG